MEGERRKGGREEEEIESDYKFLTVKQNTD